MESKDDNNKENIPPLDLIQINDELRTQSPTPPPPLADDRPMHMDPEPEDDEPFRFFTESRWEPVMTFKRQREADEKEEGNSFKIAKTLAAMEDMLVSRRDEQPDIDHRDVTPWDM